MDIPRSLPHPPFAAFVCAVLLVGLLLFAAFFRGDQTSQAQLGRPSFTSVGR
jgi:hypothetical protein